MNDDVVRKRAATLASSVVALCLLFAARPASPMGETPCETDGKHWARETIRYALAAGRFEQIDVTVTNGSVTVTGDARADSIHIEATRAVGAFTSEEANLALRDLNISLEGSGSTFMIRTEAPDEWGSVSRSGIWPFTAAKRNRYSYRVDFVITVPRSYAVRSKTMNGDISAEMVRAADIVALNGEVSAQQTESVRARTTNGSVRAESVSGPVDLATINGNVTCAIVGAVGATEIRTTNGSVTLAIPSQANAELVLANVNGGISTSIPDTEFRRLTKERRSLRGTLGSGGPIVRIATVNGSINVRTQ